MKSIKFSLAWQILFAMVLGILLGSYLHYHSDSRVKRAKSFDTVLDFF